MILERDSRYRRATDHPIMGAWCRMSSIFVSLFIYCVCLTDYFL